MTTANDSRDGFLIPAGSHLEWKQGKNKEESFLGEAFAYSSLFASKLAQVSFQLATFHFCQSFCSQKGFTA